MSKSEDDKQKYKEQLRRRDEATLDERVERWSRIESASFDSFPNNLAWHYLNDIGEMFTSGHFIGSILLCAALMETVLSDRVKTHLQMTQDDVEHFTLDQLILLASHLKIVNQDELGQLNELKKLRNSLIHAKADQLARTAKKHRLTDSSEDSLDMDFYLLAFGEGGIQADAERYLTLARDITIRFYGTKDS